MNHFRCLTIRTIKKKKVSKKKKKNYFEFPMIFSSLDHHQITNQKMKRQVITRKNDDGIFIQI